MEARQQEPNPSDGYGQRSTHVIGDNRFGIPGLEAARLAPSAHNTQPWQFRKRNNLVLIGWDKRRELPAGDPHCRYLLTGLGAAVESMGLAAARAGLAAEVYFDLSLDAQEAASITFVPNAAPKSDVLLAEVIPHRQTTRLPFRNDAVPGDTLNALIHQGEAHGCSLALITERHKIHQIADTLTEATALNFADAKIYEEFFRWVRLNREDPNYWQDGLTLESLCLGWLKSRLAPWVLPPTGMRLLKAARLHRVVASAQGGLARKSPAVGLLTAPSHSLHHMFSGGRAMMRLWLEATRLGLRVHPITAAMDQEETRLVLADLFGVPSNSAMVVCIRIGFGPEAPRSPRLPVEDLLIDESTGRRMLK